MKSKRYVCFYLPNVAQTNIALYTHTYMFNEPQLTLYQCPHYCYITMYFISSNPMFLETKETFSLFNIQVFMMASEILLRYWPTHHQRNMGETINFCYFDILRAHSDQVGPFHPAFLPWVLARLKRRTKLSLNYTCGVRA